jgi:hypothetical protein
VGEEEYDVPVCNIMMTSLPLDFRISLKDVIKNSSLIREIGVRTMRKTEVVWAIKNSFRTGQRMFGAFDDPCRYIQELWLSR